MRPPSWFRFLVSAQGSAPWVLYTRPGCTLCDQLAAAAVQLGLVADGQIRFVDVDQDRALKKLHGLRLPVLEVGGTEVFAGRYDEGRKKELIRAVRAASRSWRSNR